MPSTDYNRAAFVLADISAQVYDNNLTSTNTFNAVKVKAKEYFKYLANVTPEDESTDISPFNTI